MDYTYSTSTYTTSGADNASGALLLGMAFFFLFFFALISYAVMAFLLGRLFKKAGVPQWVAWVPIYNVWKFLELGGQYGFWSVLSFVPFLGLISYIFMALAAFNIGKKLGKADWFVVIAIFLPLVWLIWVAFDDSKWPQPTAKNRVTKKRK
jgi:hypothetical protein